MVKMIKFSTQLIHCAISNCYWEDPVTQFNRWEEKNRDNVRIINTFFTTMDKTEIVVVTYEELKTQESKQYLEWEDLKFNKKAVFTKVRMGEAIYGLVIGFDYTEKETIFLRTDSQQIVFHEKDKQFFNNLHLERME